MAFFSSADLRANDIKAKVTAVVDGNTIEVETPGEGIRRIVFDGIDCPELSQSFGAEARAFVSKSLLNKTVTLQIKGKDRLGNVIAVVMVGDEDVRIELLKRGFAWTQEKNPATELEGYRRWAAQKGKGLWKDENAIAPWTYRRQQSMKEPKSS